MTGWITSRLPWALLALYLVMGAAHLLLAWLILRDPDLNLGVADSIANVMTMPSFVALAAVGTLIASRHPDNRFGWLMCGIALVWETYGLLDCYAVYAFGTRDGDIFGSHVAMWAGNWMFYPALCLTVAFVPLLFPSGHLPAGRWRIVFWMALVGTLCASAGFAFEPTTFETDALADHPGIPNPYGFNRWVADILFLIGFPLTIPAGIAAGVSIVWRLRRARGVERQQLKWIAYVGAIAAAIFGVNTMLFIIDLDIASTVWILQVVSFAAFPIAAGIAIVRYQLFDIDLLIRRTLVYAGLTLSLIAVYLTLVIGFSAVVRVLSGQSSSIVTAASTLVVAALFQPLRRRFQQSVDRRFYRRSYDAVRTLDTFSARLRDEVHLSALTGELQAVVYETMQPARVSVWLRSPGREAAR